MINCFDQRQVYEATMHACLSAVAEGFPHLAIHDIIDPPRQWFDAALARQIALHLMVSEFFWPKRRVAKFEERTRESVNRALRTIDSRLECPRFAAHYRQMRDHARALLLIQTSEFEAA